MGKNVKEIRSLFLVVNTEEERNLLVEGGNGRKGKDRNTGE